MSHPELRHPALRPGLEVYWKDEGENESGQRVGPITVIDPAQRDADPEWHPILGSPNADDYTLDLGWDTADEAERVGNFCGTRVHFE